MDDIAYVRYIPIIDNDYIVLSQVWQCEYQGDDCMGLFIKTLKDQPEICTKCLQELGAFDNYKSLYKRRKIHE